MRKLVSALNLSLLVACAVLMVVLIRGNLETQASLRQTRELAQQCIDMADVSLSENE